MCVALDRATWSSKGNSCTSGASRTFINTRCVNAIGLRPGDVNALYIVVTHRRKCSFYDLAESSSTVVASTAALSSTTIQEATPPQRLEVILKIIDDELSIDHVDTIRHGVNVGDVVRIHGFVERTSTSILLHARNITQVTSWKELHPGEALLPSLH